MYASAPLMPFPVKVHVLNSPLLAGREEPAALGNGFIVTSDVIADVQLIVLDEDGMADLDWVWRHGRIALVPVVTLVESSTSASRTRLLTSGVHSVVDRTAGPRLLGSTLRSLVRLSYARVTMFEPQVVRVDERGQVIMMGRPVRGTGLGRDLLRILVEAHGDLVSNEELRVRLSSTPDPVADQELRRAVRSVRAVLAGEPNRLTITNVRRLGYRLDAR